MNTSNFVSDKSVGDKLKLTCALCKRVTNHGVLKSILHAWIDIEDAHQGDDEYLIVQCLGCEEVSFCVRSTDSDAMDYETGDYLENIRQFPNINVGHLSISLPYSTPQEVKSIYNETSNALSQGMTSLAAIGTRLIVELICKNEGAAGGGLSEMIDSLHTQGIISSGAADAIHGVRFFGNEATHTSKVKNYELDESWQVINMIITYIYGSKDSQEQLLTPARATQLAEYKQQQLKKITKIIKSTPDKDSANV